MTLRDNVEGWRRWRLRPRVLVDVSEVSTATELLGRTLSMPVGIAPVAFQRLVDPEGELAMARAAAEAGTLFTLSTIATARPSEVAAAVPDGRRWFQLYCFRDEGVTRALMEEAIDSGFEAIALTVDAPRAGRRERDLRTEFAVPADVRVPSLDAAIGGNRPVTVHEVFAQVDPALGWQAVADLASECSVPLLVKGIQTHEDASLALDHGAAGVIVSNHGGRQLDCVSATADILPEVVEAVDGRATVLVDGGIRRGTDVLVALALGADSVLAGRAPLWGLAAGGAEGAGRVLELLRSEIELALTLCGSASPAEMGRPHVRRAPP